MGRGGATGLVARTVYSGVPPRAEYGISDLGPGLSPVFASLVARSRPPSTR